MLFRPCLAVRAFIFTDHQNCDIRALGSRNRFLNLVGLRFRINHADVVVEPAMPVLVLVRESATFGIDDLCLVAHSPLDAIEDCHAMRWPATVSAKMESVCSWPDHGDRLQLPHIERQ